MHSESRGGTGRAQCFAPSAMRSTRMDGSFLADPSLRLAQTARFEKADRAKPTPIVSSPISGINGSGLAVFGSGSAAATLTGSAATGGRSTTWASSIGSPVGATAWTGDVFKASTGAVASSVEVASTGVLVSFANSIALDFAYTNS